MSEKEEHNERGKNEINDVCEDALCKHQSGDLELCIARLRVLQPLIAASDRQLLSVSVVCGLCRVIQREAKLWVTLHPSISSLKVVSSALCCLRNALPNCSRNQLMVAESEDLLHPVIRCLKWTFCQEHQDAHSGKDTQAAAQHDEKSSELQRNIDSHTDTLFSTSLICCEIEVGKEKVQLEEWRKALSTLASACVTCLGNLVAANSITRRIIWRQIKPLLGNMLSFPDKEVAQASCMALHNFLLEPDLRDDLYRYSQGEQILKHLLTLYQAQDTKYSCFVLLAIEILMARDGLMQAAWDSLDHGLQCLVLEVLESRAARTADSRDVVRDMTPSILFAVAEFKDKADEILRTASDRMKRDSAQILTKMGRCLCAIAASDCWRPLLQQDKSLLVTCVALLQCIKDIGKIGGNAFTPIDRFSDTSDKEIMALVENHPAFGFKCDLIRLIASLVYQNPANQDLVREMDGLLLVLESSQFDARNPMIKEACIFALRNLLEGNKENQLVIKELQIKGVAKSEGLRELGMEVVLDGDRIRIVQQSQESSSSISSSAPSGI